MNQPKRLFSVASFAWISVISLVVTNLLLPNAAHSATSGTVTVGFSIAGGDMGGGGGGGDSCLPVDYTLSTILGADVPDPTAGSSWTSSDIGITQTDGTSCPGPTPVTATSISITATNFSNGLGNAPNILCDGELPSNTYSADGASANCSNTTTIVNVNVTVPAEATTGVVYESIVTITAVL